MSEWVHGLSELFSRGNFRNNVCELFLFVLQTNEIILLRNLIHWKFQQIPYFLSVPNYTHLYRTHTHSLSLFQWHRFSTRRLCSAPSAKASVPRFSLGILVISTPPTPDNLQFYGHSTFCYSIICVTLYWKGAIKLISNF